MEPQKKLGLSLNLRNPVDAYRVGWMVLAATSVIYLFFIVIRAGLGLNHSTPVQTAYHSQPDKHQQASYSQDSRNQGNTTSAASNTRHFSQRNRNQRDRNQAANNTHYRTTGTVTNRPDNRTGKSGQLITLPQKGETTKRRAVQRKQGHNKKTNKVVRKIRHPNHNRKNNNQALNYMSNANYMQKFTYDLQNPVHTKPVIKVLKAREVNSDIFGVKLAKGKSIRAIRQEWRRLKRKYRRPLRNLEPLIIKEKTGDGYPIQLIVGPFSDSPSAVRFCSTIRRRFNCNLKRYNGSPL